MTKTHANPGSLHARIEALKMRHAALDERIRDEQNRPLPSVSRLRMLKRHKLSLKDEMTYYDGVLRTVSAMDRSDAEQRA
jgi:hypothetical protein